MTLERSQEPRRALEDLPTQAFRGRQQVLQAGAQPCLVQPGLQVAEREAQREQDDAGTRKPPPPRTTWILPPR